MKAHGKWLWVIAVIGAVVLTGCGPSTVTKYDVAKKLAAKGDYQGAISAYQEFITANPDSSLVPYAMYNIALTYRGADDNAAALAAYQKLIEQYPTKDPAQWAAADVREMQTGE
jgi:TolA-binding protein